jgi:glutaredoxin 3
MSDTAWTIAGFAALLVNLFALVGAEKLRKPGRRSLGAVPFLVLIALCGLWFAEDPRPAVRGALALLAVVSLAGGAWSWWRFGRVVHSPVRGGETPMRVTKPVLIYTMTRCPYCVRAKELLRSKGVPFEEVDLDQEEARWDECERRSGRETVPQIFIGDRHVGGCDDILALEDSGELDDMLRATPAQEIS